MTPFVRFQILWFTICTLLIFWFVDFFVRAPDWLYLILYDCNQGDSWSKCDPMSLSGFAAFLAGATASVIIDRSQVGIVEDWRARGMIECPDEAIPGIARVLLQTNIRWQSIFAGIIVVAVFGGYWLAQQATDGLLEFVLASAVCAILAGARMGRAVAHGLIGRVLRDHGVKVHVVPGHPDRTGGLARIGDFYLLQALTALVPVFWLLGWLFALQLVPEFHELANWVVPYTILLAVALRVFAAAFLLPMGWYHREMRSFRRNIALKKAANLRIELFRMRRAGEVLFFSENAKDHIEQIESLVDLPEYPISPATRKLFVTTLLVPVISAVVKGAIDVAATFLKAA